MPQGAINKWRFYSESEGAVAGRVEGLHRRRLPTALAGLQASARVKICCLLEKLPALRLLLQEVREHILVRAGSGGTGTIRLCSTPAEEGGAGKVYRIRSGLFSDVDAALAWHPGDRNDASPRKSLANVSAKFRFHGQSAHAAAAPDKGRSALDGAEAMNYMVNLMREHVPSDARLHYVITNGGEAPNVVPDFAEVFYYCRHPEVDTVMRMKVGEEYHVCNCEGCDCNTVSSVAGKCGCGNDLVAAEVTKVEGNSAYFKAAAWNQDRSFNMVGKYVCGCGPTCTCKTISQKPGKCGCGSDLKKVGN